MCHKFHPLHNLTELWPGKNNKLPKPYSHNKTGVTEQIIRVTKSKQNLFHELENRNVVKKHANV